ncbi:uncharacterized protein KY384_006427 [Bacidia gigantensis]|uniref:uncharacterized protein n=1 Tax=Bacidia gigantensis TaxID=2732470 RepID=UPI001D045EBE|nr:uncharacterized protein KY384_006427 [Bacidia gigantensis]KAG8528740.1 hypothetical protein KY384_006427 [Bacidia gigantensis]
MPSPLVSVSIQSFFITLCSCFIAHYLNPGDPPHYFSLLVYGLLATSPNFLWQQKIEQIFPSYKLKKVKVDEGGNGAEVEKKLSAKNTLIKVVLDQTVAALPNVVGYIGVTRLLRGVPPKMCWAAVKEVGPALVLTIWWFNGGRQELDEVKLNAAGLGKGLLTERRMHNYQFYPVTNPKIHFMGRWTATPNHLRKDGTFPGVYFDIVVKNTTSLFIALHNAPVGPTSNSATSTAAQTSPTIYKAPDHLSFHPLAANQAPSPPVSLLARIDDAEYVILSNASKLVTVSFNTLSRHHEHHIRIVAPMIDDGGRGIVELEGLWLSKGGFLIKVAGSMLDDVYIDEDILRPENSNVGEKHRAGLSELENDGTNRLKHFHQTHEIESDLVVANQDRKKILEVVTDFPGSSARTGATERLLAGVTGWEYLLGEMFKADHVGIWVDGMCLIQECIGGNGFPVGVGDVFFRSGPYSTEYFKLPWMFTSYIPDVLVRTKSPFVGFTVDAHHSQVINLGESDHFSFKRYQAEYNQTMWQLSESFENTYISLVQGIRRLGYERHPAIVLSERLGFPGVIPHNVPASVPIFIMRPLTGRLEHATQNIVNRLRAHGDRSVFWVDTSGWLDSDVTHEVAGDLYLDESLDPARMRLTELGNQRVAMFLHAHVCQHLASVGDECAFLPQEVYQGTAYDQEEANFNRYLEAEKEQRLRELFWLTGQQEKKESEASAADIRSM